MLVCNSFLKLQLVHYMISLRLYLMNILRIYISLNRSNRCTDSALVYVRNESCDDEVDYPYVNIVLENPEREQSYDMSRCMSQWHTCIYGCIMYMHAMSAAVGYVH